MSGLFGGKKEKVVYPDPEPPATMPDPEDPIAKRQRTRSTRTSAPASASSAASDRLTRVPGTLGREFSRGTLGAG
jgi:hypothetical protein